MKMNLLYLLVVMILKDIIKIELEDNNVNHKVYVFYNSNMNYFKYDFKTHLIVG